MIWKTNEKGNIQKIYSDSNNTNVRYFFLLSKRNIKSLGSR